jgi:hypothetical protein
MACSVIVYPENPIGIEIIELVACMKTRFIALAFCALKQVCLRKSRPALLQYEAGDATKRVMASHGDQFATNRVGDECSSTFEA